MPPILPSPQQEEGEPRFDPRYDEEDANSAAPFAGLYNIPDFAAEHRQSRPTLSDIDVLPRRRLRDGSASTSTSTSRSSSGLVGVLSRPSNGNIQTRFGALREQSLQRARNGVLNPMSAKSSPSASPPPMNPSQRGKKRSASVISISSDDGIELIEPPQRWTSKDKGKGRAPLTPTLSPSPEPDNTPLQAAKSAMPSFQDDEETALGHYSCPICLNRPSHPVMTPCGHLMCGSCLHLTLLTSIIRQLPGTGLHPATTAEESHRRRLCIKQAIAASQPKYTQGHRSITTFKNVLRLSWVGARVPTNLNELALRLFEEPKVWDEFGLTKPDSDDPGGWLLDGPCPVCRKDLKGGLGPRGYGTVIHLEPRKF